MSSAVLWSGSSSERWPCQMPSIPGVLAYSLVVWGRAFGDPGDGAAQALPRAVVHDDDLRLDGVEKSRRACAVERAVPTRLPDA